MIENERIKVLYLYNVNIALFITTYILVRFLHHFRQIINSAGPVI